MLLVIRRVLNDDFSPFFRISAQVPWIVTRRHANPRSDIEPHENASHILPNNSAKENKGMDESDE